MDSRKLNTESLETSSLRAKENQVSWSDEDQIQIHKHALGDSCVGHISDRLNINTLTWAANNLTYYIKFHSIFESIFEALASSSNPTQSCMEY